MNRSHLLTTDRESPAHLGHRKQWCRYMETHNGVCKVVMAEAMMYASSNREEIASGGVCRSTKVCA